jgi:glycosyltransferase involved in cell wall biosynthesis
MHDMNTMPPQTSAGAPPQPLPPQPLPPQPLPPHPAVEVVIPVHNEEHILAQSVRTLHAHLSGTLDLAFAITIADNASTDSTLARAHALAAELPEVSVLHLDQKGRGRALRAAWGRSEADVVAYMDVDLSTDLDALGPLLAPLLEGRGDIAIGSRLAAGAQVTRSRRREVISRTYNVLLRVLLHAGFSDAQCGFKAGRRELVQSLLADVEDEAWFFDTELLHLAQRRRLSIHEVPVRWVEDADSRVEIAATVREDLHGVMRLRRRAREEEHRALRLAERAERPHARDVAPAGSPRAHITRQPV